MSRTLVWVTVALMVAVAVVSGPLVGGIDLTPPDEQSRSFCDLGSASVTVEQPPATDPTLERGRFGSDTYTLAAEDATVTVENVEQCPRLVYRIEVPELGIDVRQVHFLEESSEGELVVNPPTYRLDPGEVDREAYRGTLSIELQGEQNRVLYRRNVTVTVVE